MLEEGELEQELKTALETDLQEISTLASAEFKRRALHDFETESKGTSHSGSMPGSEPLSRKEFMFEALKHSPASSVQGSKGSLSSLSSVPKGSKASLASTTPPKGSKGSLVSTTPLKGSKSSLVSTTPPKGSKVNLASTTPPKENISSLMSDTTLKGGADTVNVTPEAPPQQSNSSFSSSLLSEKQESDSEELKASSADTKVSTTCDTKDQTAKAHMRFLSLSSLWCSFTSHCIQSRALESRFLKPSISQT